MKYVENTVRSFLPNDQKAYDEVQKIIATHALAAAVAATASGWIPGAGETIAAGIALGFVISMYYRLAKRVGVNLPRNAIKAIASVVVAEIVACVATTLVFATVITLFPGVGNVSGALLAGVVNYCIVQGAGELFLMVLDKLFRAKSVAEIEAMSTEELKAFAKGCSTKKTVKECVKAAKEDYVHVRNDKKLKVAAAKIVPEKE